MSESVWINHQLFGDPQSRTVWDRMLDADDAPEWNIYAIFVPVLDLWTYSYNRATARNITRGLDGAETHVFKFRAMPEHPMQGYLQMPVAVGQYDGSFRKPEGKMFMIVPGMFNKRIPVYSWAVPSDLPVVCRAVRRLLRAESQEWKAAHHFALDADAVADAVYALPITDQVMRNIDQAHIFEDTLEPHQVY
jgi:hypothetical protein